MALSPLTPSDPHRLGGYWLAGRLGAGGQGVVYEAYGEAGERVAVKVPRLDDPASRARLTKEAAAARRVASFCTARVIEARTDVPEPFIVSEYVPGPSLREVIGEAGPYEGDMLRRLAIGVATALTAIHQVGVVHRDLKPDNIILGPDGPRVIDFGVAREPGLPGTTTGPLMGTPNYMAPEALAGRGVAAAADIWAWGLVVLFAALGHDPVPGREPFAVVTHVMGFRPDLSGVPDPLRGLVASALSQDPAARPPARAVLRGLLGGPDGDLLLAEGVSAAAGGRRPGAGGDTEPDLGAIAEGIYEQLSESERAAAPEVFLRMVTATEDGEETIRRVSRDELLDEPGSEAAASLLAVYGSAGLIAESGSGFTPAHPALIRAWPRLRNWVADNRQGLPIHRRLTQAARSWDRHGRKPADLLQGSDLDRTLQWAAGERRDITLIRLERDFLDAASTLMRRRSRRRGMLAAALSVLLVAALAGLGLAEYQRRITDRERDDATARSLALRAADLRESSPRIAMLMSVAAWRLAPALPESLGALYDSMAQSETDSFTDPDVSSDTTYATSRDGRTLVAVRSGVVTLWDVPGHRRLRRFSGVGEKVVKAALSPDGRVLALQDDHAVRLWDAAAGTALGGGFAGGAFRGNLGVLSFDPGGRRLSIPEGSVAARWWDVGRRELIRAGSGAGADAVNADGTLGVVFSTGGGRAELWDLRSGRRLRAGWLPAKKNIKDAEFSEDGRALAVTENIPSLHGLRLWLRGVPSGTALSGDGAGPVWDDIAFGYHGRFLALSRDRHLIVLRLADGQVVLQRDLGAPVEDLRFDEADRAVRILTDAGTVFTVDVKSLLDRPALPGSPDGIARLGPGGRMLALYGAGEVRLWDVRAARGVGRPIKLDGSAWQRPALAFSGDGSRLAVGGTLPDGYAVPRVAVSVVETATGKTIGSFPVSNREAQGVDGLAFSPDGTGLAVAPTALGTELPLELWTVDGATVRTVKGVTGSAAMAYRPDGKLLVAGFAPELTLVDPVKAARMPRPSGSGSLASGPYSFSPDGARVVIGGAGLSLWDSRFRGSAGPPFAGDGGISALVWSPDGRMVASYEAGDVIRLWDMAADPPLPLGAVFDGQTSGGRSEGGFGQDAALAFGPDGRTLYSATPEGVVRAHVLDGERAASVVCDRAGQPLSRQEWRRYLREVEYRDVCGRAVAGGGLP
ncbi:WD40 repeat domain-containing serine/threonine protein kinase [Planotetraspora sp. A-T 1434]|uniref:WD40 repeat domain-containing serine/threonine protein kinase n=1 Tax=Planotetraspora sp. A-T 1434 TaxID=2979219 RepID=UPI0021C0384E|nr:WD40 repeat domain-containing serine/threonine protein kinase [Planotetraspora sp. A-T 1434]MCT9934637.1 WD40 repeat domain-containing serine/threonine protein kinase [Planotetraspora sp. A-T 1434]